MPSEAGDGRASAGSTTRGSGRGRLCLDEATVAAERGEAEVRLAAELLIAGCGSLVVVDLLAVVEVVYVPPLLREDV